MLSTDSDLQTSWAMMNFSKTLKLFMTLFCNIFIIFFLTHIISPPHDRQLVFLLANWWTCCFIHQDMRTFSPDTLLQLLQISTSRKCRYTIVNYNTHWFSSTKWVNLTSTVKIVFKHRLRTTIHVSLHSVCLAQSALVNKVQKLQSVL